LWLERNERSDSDEAGTTPARAVDLYDVINNTNYHHRSGSVGLL